MEDLRRITVGGMLEEIANKLGLSRERTRQIRDKALKRLRTEPNSQLHGMYVNQ